MKFRGVFHTVLIGVLVLSMATPLTGWTAASLGVARGVSSAKLSIDGGKTWLPLGGRSLPVLDGAQLRSASGGATLDLSDGSRISILPFSSLQFRDTGQGTQITLTYGRIAFKLPEDTRLRIVTPSARLEPVRTSAMKGELFVGSKGVMGLKMTEGSLQVRSLGEPRVTMLASLEPVYLPQRPAGSDSLFTTETPPPAPANAKPVFGPGGESVGYVGPDGKLVVYPGFTANLTRPYAPRLIQLAMASIPQDKRS